MNKIKGSNFPDPKYLQKLVDRLKGWFAGSQEPLDQLITFSSVAMNNIGDYISDESISWRKQTLAIDDLWLTGTNPEWNTIILDQCEHLPKKLRVLFETNPTTVKVFERAHHDEMPILVKLEDEKYKVFDGMHRTIAAIREGENKIEAFVAIQEGRPLPKCEAHIIYDLIRPYKRKINTNREQLIAALRFLRHSYSNVDYLLKNRFNSGWIPDDEVQQIIQESLVD